jgi:DNA mismatch repair protein MutS
LEEGRGSKQNVVNELPLFSMKQPEMKKDDLRERLDSLKPDEVSPREALDLIYELKRLGRE